MRDLKFLNNYLNAYSPVGVEGEGQDIWIKKMKDIANDVITDAYGSAYAFLKGDGGDDTGSEKKTVIIEAHADEIAWIVNYIEKDGNIRVKRHGGSDTAIAPSKTVIIHTEENGKIEGVFGSPAIHVKKERDGAEKCNDPEGLWIDVGFDSDEKVAELGIQVGDTVTFDDSFRLIGDYYVGRSLDDKIGGYINAMVMQKIVTSNVILPFDLVAINSVQEEVGLFGAKKAAKALKADLAIIHDVCHNTNTPKMNKAKNGDIKGGSGPCVEFTTQNHRGINKAIIKMANQKEIPVQRTVGSYGNNTVAFFLENTPTAIIASPVKYMHTTVEMVHKDDVKNAIKLLYHFIINLTEVDIEKFNTRA